MTELNQPVDRTRPAIVVSAYQHLAHALRQFEVRHCISILGRAEVAQRGWPEFGNRALLRLQFDDVQYRPELTSAKRRTDRRTDPVRPRLGWPGKLADPLPSGHGALARGRDNRRRNPSPDRCRRPVPGRSSEILFPPEHEDAGTGRHDPPSEAVVDRDFALNFPARAARRLGSGPNPAGLTANTRIRAALL